MDVVKRGEERIRDYINQDIELFAEGFARYVTNREKVRRDAPLLAKVYDDLFDIRLELKAIFGGAQQPIGKAQDG
jgi:hypothetical protein